MKKKPQFLTQRVDEAISQPVHEQAVMFIIRYINILVFRAGASVTFYRGNKGTVGRVSHEQADEGLSD